MLLHRHAAIPFLFGDLRFVVIDEIHAFLRGDRGGQTLCLVERLSRLAGVNPRRVGLSATVGDPQAVGQFLAEGTGRPTVIPRLQQKGDTRWRLSMQHFFTLGKGNLEGAQGDGENRAAPQSQPSGLSVERADADGTPATPGILQQADPGYTYIFNHTRGHKCLIFANSREECEVVTATLRGYCEAAHEPDRFLIHHGNLSVSYRESAEDVIKQDDSLVSVCTTSTLELGIDIGRLERAFQIDAPFTVSSFLQRMGRTGRRGAPSEMWFVLREDPTEARALLPETIPWKLLQAIALIQLYLEDRWVEPPREGRLPYSLLYHQTMSILAAQGEMLPAELASRVLTLSPFRLVTKDDFRLLLRHLLSIQHLQQTERGGLIVGLAGERVVGNFKFYAVFQENEEYTVRWESKELGTIVQPPPVQDRIAIAGRVWVVEEVDTKRHLVYCQPVKGVVPAYFGDVAGDVHTRVLERMWQLLRQHEVYPYLLSNAVARLAQARDAAAKSGLGVKPLIPLGGAMYSLTPWLGSYAFLALERFLRLRCAHRLQLKGFTSVRPYYMQFSLGVSAQDFFRILAEEVNKPLDPMELLYPKETPVFDKYDEFLPVELTRKGFAQGVLNLQEMVSRVKGWV